MNSTLRLWLLAFEGFFLVIGAWSVAARSVAPGWRPAPRPGATEPTGGSPAGRS
jgi:hypothetical protein